MSAVAVLLATANCVWALLWLTCMVKAVGPNGPNGRAFLCAVMVWVSASASTIHVLHLAGVTFK